jgi:hypothetical protein
MKGKAVGGGEEGMVGVEGDGGDCGRRDAKGLETRDVN